MCLERLLDSNIGGSYLIQVHAHVVYSTHISSRIPARQSPWPSWFLHSERLVHNNSIPLFNNSYDWIKEQIVNVAVNSYQVISYEHQLQQNKWINKAFNAKTYETSRLHGITRIVRYIPCPHQCSWRWRRSRCSPEWRRRGSGTLPRGSQRAGRARWPGWCRSEAGGAAQPPALPSSSSCPCPSRPWTPTADTATQGQHGDVLTQQHIVNMVTCWHSNTLSTWWRADTATHCQHGDVLTQQHIVNMVTRWHTNTLSTWVRADTATHCQHGDTLTHQHTITPSYRVTRRHKTSNIEIGE